MLYKKDRYIRKTARIVNAIHTGGLSPVTSEDDAQRLPNLHRVYVAPVRIRSPNPVNLRRVARLLYGRECGAFQGMS